MGRHDRGRVGPAIERAGDVDEIAGAERVQACCDIWRRSVEADPDAGGIILHRQKVAALPERDDAPHADLAATFDLVLRHRLQRLDGDGWQAFSGGRLAGLDRLEAKQPAEHGRGDEAQSTRHDTTHDTTSSQNRVRWLHSLTPLRYASSILRRSGLPFPANSCGHIHGVESS